MIRFSTLILVAIAALSTGCQQRDNPVLDSGADSETGFETILKGSFGGLPTRQQIVVTNESDWRNLWNDVHRGKNPVPALPSINFNTSTVVALFLGMQAQAGHSVDVERVAENITGVKVSFKEMRPGSNCMIPAHALDSPYRIIKIGSASKSIMFSSQVADYSCGD